MKEFITKKEYTMATVSDGIVTGKLVAKIHKPVKDKSGLVMSVLVEHFIINKVEVNVEIPGEETKTEMVDQPIILRSQNITYRMDEFTKIIADNKIFIPLDETGIPGLEAKVADIIMEQLVRSGGSKGKGTYAVPAEDWEVVVKK